LSVIFWQRGPVGCGSESLVVVFEIVYIEYIQSLQKGAAMSQAMTTTMTVRLSGSLREFVAANVGEQGDYESVSEYMRDLIRRDKARVEQETFERLKAELARAYAAPESSYQPLTAADVIARNRI
jgi:putative addiction module CopG family antidote